MYYTLMYTTDEYAAPPILLFTSRLDISWIADSLNEQIGRNVFSVETSKRFEDYGRDAVREECRPYADY